MQKTPNVNREDVVRVIKRDFPHQVDEVLRVLKGVKCSFKPHRLHLAHLKLSGGSLQRLRDSLLTPDWRDVLSHAEYPGYLKIAFRKKKTMTTDEVQAVVDSDWRQYETWLNAKL